MTQNMLSEVPQQQQHLHSFLFCCVCRVMHPAGLHNHVCRFVPGMLRTQCSPRQQRWAKAMENPTSQSLPWTSQHVDGSVFGLLQKQLSEASGALQKQWRELTASFEDQLRHLELECSTKLEQAAQQVQLVSQRAADREAEAQQAHSKERAAADTAAVSQICGTNRLVFYVAVLSHLHNVLSCV